MILIDATRIYSAKVRISLQKQFPHVENVKQNFTTHEHNHRSFN